jgi:hypothetical protein
MEEKVQQRMCINFCFCLGKTGAEMYEMLQAAFGESCPSQSKTFEWCSHFKSRHWSFEDDPCPGRLSTSHTEETVAHVREIIRADRHLTIREVYRGCWNIIRYMPENYNWRIANETCVSEICAPSPDGRAEGWSHVGLHWPPWASLKRSQLHVFGNHWWQKLGLRVWPGNKANVLPVKNCIISSTEESMAGEVQCQNHVDRVLRHW